MNWNPQQAHALDAVNRWIKEASRPFFYLAGYAGTGKTVLACHLAENAGGEVMFAAYTGKAAHCMRKAGCHGASTIHSLIYLVRNKSRAVLIELELELEELLKGRRYDPNELQDDPIEVSKLRALIARERENLGKLWFDLNPESPLRDAALLVVDECSMVDERVAADLLSFQVPLLVLGDPAQLPPVFGAGYFTGGRPDAFLTEIHRQARDNPIVAMATDVREGRQLEYGAYGESKVVPRAPVDPQPGVQILVGRNETRRKANAKCRLGRGVYPEVGDRLVCLRNDHTVGLLNGSTWNVVESVGYCPDDDTVGVQIASCDEADDGLVVNAHAAPFRGDPVLEANRRDAHEFDYGYALTVHKAQGSQWPEVFVLDESWVFKADARRHLYTALTRASEKVTVMR